MKEKNTKRKHRKHKSRPTIQFFSKKNNAQIWCQSYFEMFFALLLEFDDTVESYGSQVESIMCEIGRYTPDFLVLYSDNSSCHFEIHHPVFLTEEYQDKFAAYQQYILNCSNEPLVMVTDLEVSNQAIKNLQDLYQFKNEFDLNKISEEIARYPESLSFGALMKLVEKFHQKSKQFVKALLAEHFYSFNFDLPIDNNTMLYRSF
ncbi:hypothetical protein AADZ86_08525 [Colwelliaceae bacterium BS250]